MFEASAQNIMATINSKSETILDINPPLKDIYGEVFIIIRLLVIGNES
jgi:hypothetical protein